MSADRDADAILLEGIQVPAALGVTAAERAMRRPVVLDLEVGFDLARSGASDRIQDTIDYGHVYEIVEKVAGGRDHRLVEALGERIADALLACEGVGWVRVTVRKVKPISGVLDYAGVRITRRRA